MPGIDPEAPATVETILEGFSLTSEEGSAGFGGVYLVTATQQGRRRRILFDCAHVGRRRALCDALARRGLDREDIDTVVISHAHWDHVQNVDLFSGARVLLHPAEYQYLSAPDPDDTVTPPWMRGILDVTAWDAATDGVELAPGVLIMGLPGHTPGSIGLRVATAAGTAVLSGDALSSAHAARTGRCTLVFDDAERAAASIGRIVRTADIVYPGHDRAFRISGRRPGGYLPDPPTGVQWV